MFGEIGNLRNRLRQYRINKKRNKKQKTKKGKYISYIAIPYSILANFFLSFFGKTKNTQSKQLQNIKKEIKTIEESIEIKIKNNNLNTNETKIIEQQLTNITNQITNISNSKNKKTIQTETKKLIEKVDKVHKIIQKNTKESQKIESKPTPIKTEEPIISKEKITTNKQTIDSNITNIQKEKIENVSSLQIPNKKNKVLNKTIPYVAIPLAATYQIVDSFINKPIKDNQKQNKKEETLKDYIKINTKQIKEMNKQITTIEKDLSKIEDERIIRNLLFELDCLKKQLERMQEQYKELKNQELFLQTQQDLEEIDIYKLRKDDTILKQLTIRCTQIESNYHKQKEQKLNQKEKINNKQENNNQKKEEKIKEEKVSNLLQELHTMQEITKKQLERQKKEIQNIQKKFPKHKRKKRSFFQNFKNFFSNTINLTLSILPFSLFQNKVVGALTSAILINQTIRSARNTLEETNNFYYDTSSLISSIQNEIDCIQHTKMLMLDSLEQLSLLKTELQEYQTIVGKEDLEQIYQDLSKMENQVLEQLYQYDIYQKTTEKQKRYIKEWNKNT